MMIAKIPAVTAKRVAWSALLGLLCLTPGPARAQSVAFHAELAGAAETPATDSHGQGDCRVILEKSNGHIGYEVSWHGLSGAPTMAHLHGPAAPGASAPPVVVLEISAKGDGAVGYADLTPPQQAALEKGLFYCNVHTAQFPKGELRGQLLPE